MTKKIITINNPLTVIAIFSMLTEASAAVSLPFIDSENQKIYVWFLITFPSFLIALFFLTLNFNNQSLYSPSDFTNEENFIKQNIINSHPPSKTTMETKQKGEIPEHLGKAYSADMKFRAHTASSFVFLPQTKLHAHPCTNTSLAARKPAIQNRHIAFSLLSTAHINNMNIYLIDLNAPDAILPPKSSLNDVLHYYCKKIRTQKKNTKETCFILFLTNNRLNSILNVHKNHVSTHKKNQLPENMTVMHYNTDTATLNTFLQKPQI